MVSKRYMTCGDCGKGLVGSEVLHEWCRGCLIIRGLITPRPKITKDIIRQAFGDPRGNIYDFKVGYDTLELYVKRPEVWIGKAGHRVKAARDVLGVEIKVIYYLERRRLEDDENQDHHERILEVNNE